MRTIRLGTILEKISRPVDLGNDGEYPLMGVRLNGRGAFLRELKLGINIKKKRHFIVRHGDIVYNKLFAWRGAFAIVSKEADGCFASDKFPCYRLVGNIVTPQYLAVVFRSLAIAKQAEVRSVGLAAMSKFTLNPPRFLELEINVPTVQQQETIVRLADQLDAEITAAKAAADRLASVAQALPSASIERILRTVPSRALGEVGALVRRSLTVSDSAIYKQVTISMNNRGVRLRGEKAGAMIAVKNQAVVRANDIVFSRIDIRNGAIGLVPPDLDGAIVANDFPVFVPNAECDVEFLCAVFATRSFREQCIARSAGSTNRRKMKREEFLRLRVPFPSKARQREVVRMSAALGHHGGGLREGAAAALAHAHLARHRMFDQLAPCPRSADDFGIALDAVDEAEL